MFFLLHCPKYQFVGTCEFVTVFSNVEQFKGKRLEFKRFGGLQLLSKITFTIFRKKNVNLDLTQLFFNSTLPSTLQKTIIMAIKMKNNLPSPPSVKKACSTLHHCRQYLLFFLFQQLAFQVQPLLATISMNPRTIYCQEYY